MRLFVAIELPCELRQSLLRLRAPLPGARWIAEENLHLTLRFIGEVNRPQAEDADHALASMRGRGFTLRLSGLSVQLRNNRPSVLCASAPGNPALIHLQGKIETALQRAGLQPERRRYIPHVSLARLDASVAEPRLAAYIQAHNLFTSPDVPIRGFTLFSSRPGKEQPAYANEVEYPLMDPTMPAAAKE